MYTPMIILIITILVLILAAYFLPNKHVMPINTTNFSVQAKYCKDKSCKKMIMVNYKKLTILY